MNTELSHRYQGISIIPYIPSYIKTYDCKTNSISKIENLPENLESLDCRNNRISKIENIPKGLKTFDCASNCISKIENLPEGLLLFMCGVNSISKIENLPKSLETFFCFSGNKFSKIENLPISLRYFATPMREIDSVDNVSIDDINFTLKGYNAIKRIQLRMKRRYRLKVAAARVIQKGLYNWLWKPEGIVMRIETRNLQESLGMFQ